MTWGIVADNTKVFFDSFNIFGIGLTAIWIIASFFIASEITERKDERILATITLLLFGGLIYFADDPTKYVILIVVVLVVIYGLFRALWRKQEYK